MKPPLPSWTDGEVRDAIISFVRRVTQPTGPSFVPPDERIAVFDSDGTLWCEQPASALAFFAMHCLRAQPGPHSGPSDRELAPLRAAAARNDITPFQALDLTELSQALVHLNAGLTPEQFVHEAHAFLGSTLHPRFHLPFGRLTYRPMLELLAYLQSKDFRPFIVTGGSVEFARASSEELYGVPRERVAGATVDYAFQRLGDKVLVHRTRTLVGDTGEGEAKVRSIQQRIGRRPILAVGNSGGDAEMLEYTRGGSNPTLCLFVAHDDARREYAYPPLEASDTDLRARAAAHEWLWVSMRRDFRRVFPPARGPRLSPA